MPDEVRLWHGNLVLLLVYFFSFQNNFQLNYQPTGAQKISSDVEF